MPGLLTTWGLGMCSESPCGHPSPTTPALLEARRAGGTQGRRCLLLFHREFCLSLLAPWQWWCVATTLRGAQGQTVPGSGPPPLSGAPTCLGSRVTKPSALGRGRQVPGAPFTPRPLHSPPAGPSVPEKSSDAVWLERHFYCDISLQPALSSPSSDCRPTQMPLTLL